MLAQATDRSVRGSTCRRCRRRRAVGSITWFPHIELANFRERSRSRSRGRRECLNYETRDVAEQRILDAVDERVTLSRPPLELLERSAKERHGARSIKQAGCTQPGVDLRNYVAHSNFGADHPAQLPEAETRAANRGSSMAKRCVDGRDTAANQSPPSGKCSITKCKGYGCDRSSCSAS